MQDRMGRPPVGAGGRQFCLIPSQRSVAATHRKDFLTTLLGGILDVLHGLSDTRACGSVATNTLCDIVSRGLD